MEVIRAGFNTFVKVGVALMDIRDRRLYRHEFGTWEQFCREVTGQSKTHANRTILAACVVNDLAVRLADCPGGGGAGDVPLPHCEALARELARITEPEDRLNLWRRLLSEAGGKRITATAVSMAIPRNKLRRRPPPIDPTDLGELRSQLAIRIGQLFQIQEFLKAGAIEEAKSFLSGVLKNL